MSWSGVMRVAVPDAPLHPSHRPHPAAVLRGSLKGGYGKGGLGTTRILVEIIGPEESGFLWQKNIILPQESGFFWQSNIPTPPIPQ